MTSDCLTSGRNPVPTLVMALGTLTLSLILLMVGSKVGLAAGVNEAWVLLLQGQYEEARRVAEADLTIGADRPRAAVCLVEALHMLGHDDEIPRDLLETGTGQTEIAPLLASGKHGLLHRRNEEAEAHLRRALDVASEQGDSSAELVAVEQLANIFQNVGRFPEAIEFHERALQIATARGDSLVLISSTYGLAYCLISRGEHSESWRLTERALEGAQLHNLHLWIGNIEGLRATLAWLRLDLTAVITHLEIAEKAYRDAADGPRQASCLRRIAATHISTGSYPLAIENLQSARAIALAAGDTVQASFCLEHLGSIHADLGDLDRAQSLWEEALREGGARWPSEWTNGTLSNLGSLLVTRGRYEEALEVFRNALDALEGTSSELNLAGTLTRLAICLRESGRPGDALEQLDRAVSSARQYELTLSEAQALKEKALCHLDLREFGKAAQHLSEASQLARNSGFQILEQQILRGQAQVARARGDPTGALRYLEEAMVIGERVRNLTREVTAVQESVFGRSRGLYDEAVDLLYEMHRAEPEAGHDHTAFSVAQRAKARSLLDLLIESEVDLRARADTTYRQREEEILHRLMELTHQGGTPSDRAAADQETARLEDEFAILERHIRSSDPHYADLRFPEPVSLESVQRVALVEGEVLVEYLLGEDRSFLWAATRDTVLFVELPSKDSIEPEVRDLLALVSDYNLLGSDPAYLWPHLERVSSILLGPLSEILREADILTVCPDGILHFLPFEVLAIGKTGTRSRNGNDPDKQQTPTQFHEVPYLIRTLDVGYAHSATAHLRFRTGAETFKREFSRQLLIVGDPVVGTDVGADTFFEAVTGAPPLPLPHVGVEIAELANLVPEKDRLVLTGRSATLSELRSATRGERFRLVHFATHGIYNEKRPRFSGILLTAPFDQSEDGFLTMNEVFSLELNCEQVVLSTCSSALGEAVTGEGLVGLTRGLLYAGAESVVAALWNVSGQATSEFMQILYRQCVVNKQADRVHALAEVKRRFVDGDFIELADENSIDYAHPYFWAAFVFTGADRALVSKEAELNAGEELSTGDAPVRTQ